MLLTMSVELSIKQLYAQDITLLRVGEALYVCIYCILYPTLRCDSGMPSNSVTRDMLITQVKKSKERNNVSFVENEEDL